MNHRVDTSSEEHRHACEVRYVASLPTKAARDRYLHGDGERRKPLSDLRGAEAAERLERDARALFQARRRGEETPSPLGESQAQPVGAPLGGERTNSVPDGGSFLAPSGEGPLRRDGCVESGAGA